MLSTSLDILSEAGCRVFCNPACCNPFVQELVLCSEV